MTADSSSDNKISEQATYLVNRLLKNEKSLRKWTRKNDFHALRLYDRDIPEIPLAIDRYETNRGTKLVVSLYERPYEKSDQEESAWLDAMIGAVCSALLIESGSVFIKVRKRMRGLSQYGRNSDSHEEAIVREAGLSFLVNLSDYLDTGLFLDHRLTRAMAASMSKGKTVLNLFSYTGSFSIYAASGGCRRVTSVDLSNTYLAWSRKNFIFNEIPDSVHEEVRIDVMLFLREARKSGRKWDFIIADPPTFSNSKKTPEDFDVNLDWPELLERCRAVLEPHGQILFSTNSRQLKWDGSKCPMKWQDITEATIPPDFRNRKIHRCWLLGESGPLENASTNENNSRFTK